MNVIRELLEHSFPFGVFIRFFVPCGGVHAWCRRLGVREVSASSTISSISRGLIWRKVAITDVKVASMPLLNSTQLSVVENCLQASKQAVLACCTTNVFLGKEIKRLRSLTSSSTIQKDISSCSSREVWVLTPSSAVKFLIDARRYQ